MKKDNALFIIIFIYLILLTIAVGIISDRLTHHIGNDTYNVTVHDVSNDSIETFDDDDLTIPEQLSGNYDTIAVKRSK